jgi:hypothetical protein
MAATTLTIPAATAPRYSLGSTGAAAVSASGRDAHYEVNAVDPTQGTRLTISLGAMQGAGALTLSLPGDRLPPKGRYAVSNSGTGGMHAAFVAGTPEHALGWFEGESGSVTITDVSAGQVSGEFEIKARGFLNGSPEDENQWVTVRGTFTARGDSAIATLAAAE